ncbi:MAG: CPBP family intramembrane metalloprotease [Deltaproteobacteria bacterium]|nr:CPBP family intramembrane metalloprotease [Deltaproteobacteria bacterium]
MNRVEHGRVNTGIALFIGLTFLGSWCMAAVLRLSGATVAPEPLGTRLFTTSLLYALTMGWQPIVATWFVRRWVDPPDQLDLGLRSAGRGFGLVGVAGTIAVAVAATGVAALLTRWGVAVVSTTMNGTAELELSSVTPSGSGALALLAAFGATVLLVWLQCFAEEVGWRGYFLPRLMERFGPWGGLFLHGAVWGLWYAPLLFLAAYGQAAPLGAVGRSLAFVVTCVLLGMLFGWLRLASKSLVPVMVANMTLTLAAGLPYVLHGWMPASARQCSSPLAGWCCSWCSQGC